MKFTESPSTNTLWYASCCLVTDWIAGASTHPLPLPVSPSHLMVQVTSPLLVGEGAACVRVCVCRHKLFILNWRTWTPYRLADGAFTELVRTRLTVSERGNLYLHSVTSLFSHVLPPSLSLFYTYGLFIMLKVFQFRHTNRVYVSWNHRFCQGSPPDCNGDSGFHSERMLSR